MNDDDLDQILKNALTSESAPTLTADFEERFQASLAPGSGSERMRRTLRVYAGAGFPACLAAMAASGLDWRISLLSLLSSVAATFPLVRPILRR